MVRLLILTALVACTDGDPIETEWEAVSLTDEGTPCLESEADAVGTVSVDAGVCLSSSCDRDATGSCEATLDGTTISVTSQFDWETAIPHEGLSCTDDCGHLDATCTVGPLPAGDYTLVLGEASTSVTVPTDEPCGFE